MLGRDTTWRQGCLLTRETALLLGLFDSADTQKAAVIISHDCDLASNEKKFEVIVGLLREPTVADKSFCSARNPRKLHLTYHGPDGSIGRVIELLQFEKIEVDRELLCKRCEVDGNFILHGDEKRALKQWLAARYGRPAFPNSFENHLRKRYGRKSSVEKEISNILSDNTDHLVGLFFDLGEFRNREVDNGESYPLNIRVVYDAVKSGGVIGRTQAAAIASSLKNLFHSAYGSPEEATEIALEECKEVADVEFSLAHLRRMDQWRLEYISLATGDDMIPADQLNM